MEKESLIPPEKDLVNKTHEYLKEIIKTISIGTLNPLIDYIIPSFHQKQFDKWCQNIYTAIIELENEKITLDSLRDNPEFISILKETLVIASKSHQVEKLEILKNSLFNSIDHISNFDTKVIYTKLLDKLSLTHLIVFIIISNNLEKFRNLDKYQKINECVLSLKPDMTITKSELIYVLTDLELNNLLKVSNDIEDEELVRQHANFTTVEENQNLPYIALTEFGTLFYDYIESK